MSATPDMNAQMSSGLSESLLQVNQISYRMPPQISITSKCTHVINYSQQASYNASNTIVFDIQTGASFVDPAASYLRFVVKPSDDLHCFGVGSAMNVFQRVVVRTNTGKELSRVENANLLVNIMDAYNNNDRWRDTLGRAQGYSLSVTGGAYASPVVSTGVLFVIPFKTLFPCMNPIGAKLVPPNIMSGLRIELTLASPNDAFCTVDQTAPVSLTSYTVQNIEAHLKTYDLADAFQRKIQEIASVNGLNYLYKEHFQTIVSPGANSNINFDIKKACSKALTARILTRPTAYLAADGRDKMASAPFNYIKFQSHIGADYFPNQPLQIDGEPSNDNINEAYYYTLYAQDKLEAWNPPTVKASLFLGKLADGKSDVYSHGIVAFNFNKSNVSDLAGYTTSNSRALLVDLQQYSPADVRLDVFLTFLRLAKVYQSNCVVLD